MFTDGYGFIVDYLAEGLHRLRKEDYSLPVQDHFELDSSLTKRDRDGTMKTLSGLLKILYPGGDCPKDKMKELLSFAMEGRVRVKKHLLRIDETFEEVDFRFSDMATGEETTVELLEHIQHPNLVQAYREETGEEAGDTAPEATARAEPAEEKEQLESGRHLVIKENQTGVSYEKLFAPYLEGAERIEIVDPYVRLFYQVRNVMEFCDMVLQNKPEGEEVEVTLLTGGDTERQEEQEEYLENLQDGLQGTGIRFDYEITWADIHARSIKTDTGWKIVLDRGLDIFQGHSENPFDLGRIDQEQRRCKPFEVTYLRQGDVSFRVEVE
jgi:ATP-dependent Lon protease